jgi:putative oxidoreductase
LSRSDTLRGVIAPLAPAGSRCHVLPFRWIVAQTTRIPFRGAVMANMLMTTSRVPGATRADVAKLLLRLIVGVLILVHGIGKIKGGPGLVLDAVGQAGLPATLGYLVYVGEVLAPLLLILGVWTRLAAIVVAVNMVVALLLVHAGQFFVLSPDGGWALELQGMYLVVALSIALLGAGRYSVAGVAGRWN